MTEIVKYLTGNFTDYNNEIHDITVCLVSSTCENLTSESLEKSPLRAVYLGYAIRNTKDSPNLDFAKKISYNRAKSLGPVLLSTRHGIIKDNVINEILQQELSYIQTYPGKFIKGYTEKEIKICKEKEAKEQYSQLDPYEKSIVNSILNGLDIEKYIKLAKNLSKCQK